MALTRIYQDIRESIGKLEENLEKAVKDFREALHGVLDGQRGSSHHVTGIDNRLSRLEGEHDRCLENHDTHDISNRLNRLESEFNSCRQERFGRRATDYPRDGIPHPFMTRETRPFEIEEGGAG